MSDPNVPQQAAAGVIERKQLSRAVQGVREDLLHKDPLLDCLVEITRIFGIPSSRAALVAGLPVDEGGLTPSLFTRAAARAGLSSKVMRSTLSQMRSHLLPVILLLNNNDACVLLSWDSKRRNARVLFPETGQGGVMISRRSLESRYAGVAIFSRPHFRFDERTPDVHKLPSKHWFWGAMLEQQALYRDVLLGALMINLISMGIPLYSMNVYDRVVPNKAVETLWVLTTGVVIALLMDLVLRMLRGYFIDMASARIDLRLSSVLYERVMGMRMESKPQSVGAFAGTLQSFNSIRDFLASATVTAFVDMPFGIFALIIMFIFAPILVIPPVVGILIMVIYSYIVQHRVDELSQTSHRAGMYRNATLHEGIAALETIKTQGAEGHMQAKWEKGVAFAAGLNRKTRFMTTSIQTFSATIQQIATIVTTVVGVYLMADNQITQGALIASGMFSGRAIAPLTALVGLMMQYNGTKASLKALNDIMDREVERPADANFIHRPNISGDIVFNNVAFVYPGQMTPALMGVSCRIRAGEKVVIIGRVGSGKTTLQKLLLGLYQCSGGSISVDGVDIRQLDPADLRRSIGYVPQDVVLFFGTMRDNITIGAPFADEDAVVAAAEVAGLTPFINSHPKGFDMMIGERGESLSGGQRQAVAIARAFLMDPPIIMLDEPTSAMDYSSEHQFKQRLKQYASDKTVIVVTHRNSLLEVGERIMVIEGGRLAADGPRDQVIEALQSGRIGRG